MVWDVMLLVFGHETVMTCIVGAMFTIGILIMAFDYLKGRW